MVAGFPPVFEDLSSISVSEVEILRTCPLRLAYRRSGRGRARSTPWARLGTVCHQILESAARGELGDPDDGFDDRYSRLWTAIVTEQEQEADATGESAMYGPASGWPTYATKRARLRRRAREIAAEAPEWRRHQGTRIEEKLSANDEPIYGYPDLIVKEPGPYRVVDYKTGVVASSPEGEVEPSYRRQVLLYAYLESLQTDGGRPIEGQVVPLTGDALRFPIEWNTVAQLVSDTHNLISESASAVDMASLGRPSADNCEYCAYAGRCPSFHRWLSPVAGLKGIAIIGTVRSKLTDPNGDLGLDVSVERGNLEAQVVRVRRINVRRFPWVGSVGIDTAICCVGLGLRRGTVDELLVGVHTRIDVL